MEAGDKLDDVEIIEAGTKRSAYKMAVDAANQIKNCLLYTSPSPRDS